MYSPSFRGASVSDRAAARPRNVARLTTLNRRAIATTGWVALATVAAGRDAQGQQEPFPGLDAYISRAVQTWKIPGLSVVIVRNDSVLYTKGFGSLSAADRTLVNDQTLFELGSTTKAFTATLAAMLVGDGKLRWTDRLADNLPGFKMSDPVANETATIRDALTHQTGIGRAELLWLGSGATRDEVIHRLRFVKPESPFRSKFSYQNVMFVAGGEAVAHAAGMSWEDLVTQRIFQPLGMASTVATSRGLTNTNTAKPHGMSHDTAYVQPPFNSQYIGPAGAILSNAHDMGQWLRFQLNDGVVNGKRLVNSMAFREIHSPQALMTPGAAGRGAEAVPITNFGTYGMGWIVEDYRHQLVWQHSGGTLGMTSQVGLLPDKHFGVVILTNMGGTTLPPLIQNYIFDRELGAPVERSNAAMRTPDCRSRAGAPIRSKRAQTVEHPADAKPPLALTAYAGTFADSLYGEATVSVVDGRLQLARGDWRGPLQYWNAANFRWTVVPPAATGPLFIKFEISADNVVTGMYFGLPGDVTLLGRKGGGRGNR